MRALYLREPGITEVRDIPKPTPRPGEALLRVKTVGLCGTDLSSFRGKNPLVSYPRVPGHEIGAAIEAVAKGVPPDFQPGMAVAVSPYTSCGTCPPCRRLRPNACRSNQTLGVQRDGALCDFISIPWQRLFRSEKLSFRELALVEPLSVGFHAVERGRVTRQDKVAVIGCGGVGLGAIAAIAFRRANAIAIDVDDGKLALARKAGATYTINSSSDSLHQKLVEITGDGPDVVMEAVGSPATYRAAVEEVASTGRVVYIGYAKEPVAYETKLFILKELDIMGSRNALGEFPDVIAMLERGTFPVNETVTSVVSLANAGETLQAWSENPQAFTKIQVEPDD